MICNVLQSQFSYIVWSIFSVVHLWGCILSHVVQKGTINATFHFSLILHCLAACDKIFIESFRRKHLVLLSLGFFRLLFILSQFLGKWRNSSSIYFLCCPFYLFTFGYFLRS